MPRICLHTHTGLAEQGARTCRAEEKRARGVTFTIIISGREPRDMTIRCYRAAQPRRHADEHAGWALATGPRRRR